MPQDPLPADWRDLAAMLESAVSRVAAGCRLEPGADLLLQVDPGLAGVAVRSFSGAGACLRIAVGPLPRQTDTSRDDGAGVPCGSIDRAASKAAAAMLDWHKDPETCEVVETQRFRLHLQWPGQAPAAIDEWAYGLWDE